ncbi:MULTISPECIES: hypothetical protein [unclassified Pseudomonas]|uniref:hypothetical protein n=1 Tax=unclassified Pseudomonas TaxID=196821 RepID=UPI000A1FBBAE|nr:MULTISPECIES: hypothetical protein [unclassified Pseudomonas]
MSQAKERPILFSGPMVRAILESAKTVTRRVMKVQPVLRDGLWQVYGAGWGEGMTSIPAVQGHSLSANCPYGQPGERLWVRETFSRSNPGGDEGVYFYRADGRFPAAMGGGRFYGDERWKPSIHMPRAASRILLEITSVRVELLQAITEAQAVAEGCQALEGCKWHTFKEAAAGVPMHDHTARDAFEALWESINGEESWSSNPWVWVVEFKRVTP